MPGRQQDRSRVIRDGILRPVQTEIFLEVVSLATGRDVTEQLPGFAQGRGHRHDGIGWHFRVAQAKLPVAFDVRHALGLAGQVHRRLRVWKVAVDHHNDFKAEGAEAPARGAGVAAEDRVVGPHATEIVTPQPPEPGIDGVVGLGHDRGNMYRHA